MRVKRGRTRARFAMDRRPLGGPLGANGTRAVSARPRLICFPSSDEVFATIVDEVARDAPLQATDELEDALRPMYPNVAVHRRELEGEPTPIWYVYRERTFPAHPGQVEEG
jgi:hypothetical protein